MAPFSPDLLRIEALAPVPSPRQTPSRQLTNAAMERFSCIAEKCEDTCCRDWAVEIDKPSLERMKKVMGRTAAGRETLVRLVVIGRPSKHTNAPAHVQLREDGSCPMLETSRLCGIQSQHGEAALSTACSVFPRTALSVGPEVEVGGSLACPEVARLVLVAENGALELRPTDRSMLPRAYVGKVLPAPSENPRAAVFAQVRAALTRMIRQPGVPLGSRYIFAASLAERIDAWLPGAAADLTGPYQAQALRRLDHEIGQLEAAPVLASLHRDLAGFDVSGEPIVTLAATLLTHRRKLPHSKRFAALLTDVFSSLQSEALGRPASTDDSVTPAQLWQVYQQRRDRLEQRMGDLVSEMFANYCTHYLQRQPLTEGRSLLDYLQRMGLHLAALRLLLSGHPVLAARLAQPQDADADREALEQAMVHVVQTYTKAVGHNMDFQEAVFTSTETTGDVRFGRLVLIAKFL